MYHAPCHDSLQGEGHLMVRRIGGEITPIGSCCSEAGTLALSRPDIAGAMLQRKRDALQAKIDDDHEKQVIVTNCPSCISGLGRNSDLGIVPQHLAVLLAESLGGSAWQEELSGMLGNVETITF